MDISMLDLFKSIPEGGVKRSAAACAAELKKKKAKQNLAANKRNERFKGKQTNKQKSPIDSIRTDIQSAAFRLIDAFHFGFIDPSTTNNSINLINQQGTSSSSSSSSLNILPTGNVQYPHRIQRKRNQR